MSKNFLLSTGIWAQTAFANLLHDEFRVYMFLRHPPECSLTGLDAHSLFTIANYTGVQPERLTEIITTLCNTTDEQGERFLYFDNGLYFVPASTLDKIKSTPKFTVTIGKTRTKYERWKSQYGEVVNRAFAAYCEAWVEEIYQYNSTPGAKTNAMQNPGALQQPDTPTE